MLEHSQSRCHMKREVRKLFWKDVKGPEMPDIRCYFFTNMASTVCPACRELIFDFGVSLRPCSRLVPFADWWQLHTRGNWPLSGCYGAVYQIKLCPMLTLIFFGWFESTWVIRGIGMEGAGCFSSLQPVCALFSGLGLNYPKRMSFPTKQMSFASRSMYDSGIYGIDGKVWLSIPFPLPSYEMTRARDDWAKGTVNLALGYMLRYISRMGPRYESVSLQCHGRLWPSKNEQH